MRLRSAESVAEEADMGLPEQDYKFLFCSFHHQKSTHQAIPLPGQSADRGPGAMVRLKSRNTAKAAKATPAPIKWDMP